MALNGCPPDSATALEMRRVLNCEAHSVEAINAAQAALNSNLAKLSSGNQSVQLTVANSLWARGQLLAAFSNTVQAAYHAPVQPLTSAFCRAQAVHDHGLIL